MNLRPSGYEPDELPDCSTPHRLRHILASARRRYKTATARHCKAVPGTDFNLSPSVLLRTAPHDLAPPPTPHRVDFAEKPSNILRL